MKRDHWISLDIACIALVARLAVIVHALSEPVWDGFYYDFGARRIAGGHGYSEDLVIAAANGTERVAWHAWAHYPVGYSGFLAAWYKVFGHGPMIGPFANALTGALLALVAHRIPLLAVQADAQRACWMSTYVHEWRWTLCGSHVLRRSLRSAPQRIHKKKFRVDRSRSQPWRLGLTQGLGGTSLR